MNKQLEYTVRTSGVCAVLLIHLAPWFQCVIERRNPVYMYTH